MRSFQIFLIIFFLLLYLLVSIISCISIKNLFHERYKKYFQTIYGIYSLLLFLTFIFLYIYPNKPRDVSNYSFYFYFNAILFIDFFTKLPIFFTGIISLFIKRNRTLNFTSLIIALGICLSMFYGFILGNKQIKTSEVQLEFSNLPTGFHEYRIVQISDAHLGSFQKSKLVLSKISKKINEIKPNLILFTGDLVNNFAYETEGWEPIFQEITSITESYSILGNHDYGDYTQWKNDDLKIKNLTDIVTSHQKLGFQILRNQNTILKSGNDSIFLIGVENWGHAPFPQYADLEKASENIPENAFKILMSHDPAHWESQIQNKENIELTFSGHTHGLQWGIYAAGIPFSLAYLTRKNWGGLYQSRNNFLYVNTGSGMVGIPWRIDMPAEITVITLKRSQVE
jgi:uncharacterized protein